jgi:hypothetical protein
MRAHVDVDVAAAVHATELRDSLQCDERQVLPGDGHAGSSPNERLRLGADDRRSHRERGSKRGFLEAGIRPKWVSSGVRTPSHWCGRFSLNHAT